MRWGEVQKVRRTPPRNLKISCARMGYFLFRQPPCHFLRFSRFSRFSRFLRFLSFMTIISTSTSSHTMKSIYIFISLVYKMNTTTSWNSQSTQQQYFKLLFHGFLSVLYNHMQIPLHLHCLVLCLAWLQWHPS